MDTAFRAIIGVKCPRLSGPVKILKLHVQGVRESYENHKKFLSLCQDRMYFHALK